MKAKVLESSDGRSVVLAEDGLFYSAEGSYQIGETIEYKERTYESRRALRRGALVRRAAAVCACLVLVLAGALYSYQNLMVYADVTLDGDMAVKYSLNRKNEVIRIEAADESGEALAEEMIENGMKGKTIETAIEYAEKYIKEHSDDPEGETFAIIVDCRDGSSGKKMAEVLNDKYGSEPERVNENKSGTEAGKEPAADKRGKKPAADNGAYGGDKEREKDREGSGSGGSAAQDPAERSDDMAPQGGQENGD